MKKIQIAVLPLKISDFSLTNENLALIFEVFAACNLVGEKSPVGKVGFKPTYTRSHS
jgi:hypothetical protein